MYVYMCVCFHVHLRGLSMGVRVSVPERAHVSVSACVYCEKFQPQIIHIKIIQNFHKPDVLKSTFFSVKTI